MKINKSLFVTLLAFFAIVFSSVSYAQTEEKDPSEMSFFERMMDRQRKATQKYTGIKDPSEAETVSPVQNDVEKPDPFKRVKYIYPGSKNDGSSYAEQRINHLNDSIDYDERLNNERQLHLEGSLDYDSQLLGERQQHLQESKTKQGDVFGHWK